MLNSKHFVISIWFAVVIFAFCISNFLVVGFEPKTIVMTLMTIGTLFVIKSNLNHT